MVIDTRWLKTERCAGEHDDSADIIAALRLEVASKTDKIAELVENCLIALSHVSNGEARAERAERFAAAWKACAKDWWYRARNRSYFKRLAEERAERAEAEAQRHSALALKWAKQAAMAAEASRDAAMYQGWARAWKACAREWKQCWRDQEQALREHIEDYNDTVARTERAEAALAEARGLLETWAVDELGYTYRPVFEFLERTSATASPSGRRK